MNEEKPSNLMVKKPLGEILAEAGLVSIHQIEIALIEQKQHNLKIGEILASHGWIKQETADFFAVKWHLLIQKTPRRPLASYLLAAALLDAEHLCILKQMQRYKSGELRLHSLAIEQGYVKQTTVDFFLKYLFKIEINLNLSFNKSYKVIKDYINGKTDFSKLELSQSPLDKVKLAGVNLDKSSLIKAKLNKSNLSNSSLIKANLMLADIESATLSNVNFKRACLAEANLRKSNLEQANFEKANLQEVDLRLANLRQANFSAADLRGAKLEPAYPYSVYYDNETKFDVHFDPIQAGWKKIE